jgi:hypothetical protein
MKQLRPWILSLEARFAHAKIAAQIAPTCYLQLLCTLRQSNYSPDLHSVGGRRGRKLWQNRLIEDRKELSSRQAMEAIYRDQDGSSTDSTGLEPSIPVTCLGMTQELTQSQAEESDSRQK